MSFGGGESKQTQKGSSKTSPIYNPRVGPLFSAESDLVKNLLFPLEGSIVQPMQRLMNRDQPLTGGQKDNIAFDQSMASQVGNVMPGTVSSDFIDSMPAMAEMNLRNDALGENARIGRALIDQRFQGLLGPTGQHTESSGVAPEGPDQTGNMIMGGIGTASAVAGTIAAIAM